MSDLISKKALVKAIETIEARYGNDNSSLIEQGEVLDLIAETPTVDAVEVVRCKDCRHCRNMPYGMCYLHTEPSTNFKGYKGDAVCVEADDFCSYGERKEVSE